AVGPDFILCVRLADKRIVLRDGAVSVDAYDGAQVIGEILGRVELEALSLCQKQVPVRREHDTATEVVRAGNFGLLAVNHLEVLDPVVCQTATTDGRGGAALSGFREG